MPEPDQPGAIAMFVDEQRVFIGQNNHTWVVIHKTASGGTAQDIAHFFAADPNMASTHYIVGQDGAIVQCVLEKDGAAGNCCEKGNFAPFLPVGQNLNIWTCSIEHVDPASDNSTPLTEAQKAASFQLVRDICRRHNIPMRKGDATGGIIGHCDIDPVDRANCPGNYPWQELWDYLEGESMDTYFADLGNDIWRCKQTGMLLGHGMLDFFRSQPAPLAIIGLPRTNEIPVPEHPDVVIQIFERTILCYDPGHVLDSPPNAGSVYAMHIDDLKSLGLLWLLSLLHIQPTQPPNTADLIAQLRAVQAAATAGLKDLGVTN